MQAIKGYFTDGRFTPADSIVLPRHAHAILVIEELTPVTQEASSFWHEFDRLVDASTHEAMPEFPRLRLGREPITFAED